MSTSLPVTPPSPGSKTSALAPGSYGFYPAMFKLAVSLSRGLVAQDLDLERINALSAVRSEKL